MYNIHYIIYTVYFLSNFSLYYEEKLDKKIMWSIEHHF